MQTPQFGQQTWWGDRDAHQMYQQQQQNVPGLYNGLNWFPTTIPVWIVRKAYLLPCPYKVPQRGI